MNYYAHKYFKLEVCVRNTLLWRILSKTALYSSLFIMLFKVAIQIRDKIYTACIALLLSSLVRFSICIESDVLLYKTLLSWLLFLQLDPDKYW